MEVKTTFKSIYFKREDSRLRCQRVATFMWEKVKRKIHPLKNKIGNILYTHMTSSIKIPCVECGEYHCIHNLMKTIKLVYNLLGKNIPPDFGVENEYIEIINDCDLKMFYQGMKIECLHSIMAEIDLRVKASPMPNTNIEFFRQRIRRYLVEEENFENPNENEIDWLKCVHSDDSSDEEFSSRLV